jgi:four helix bundle protein
MVARRHQDLEVHQRAYAVAMLIFNKSKTFPKEETYSLTDQIRRSSRSVTANIAEAWMKRRYEAMFISKLTDALGEIAETEDWIRYAVDCRYMEVAEGDDLNAQYTAVMRTLSSMVMHASSWCSKEIAYKPQATSHKPQATSHKQAFHRYSI